MESVDLKGAIQGVKGTNGVYRIQRRNPESREREFTRYLKRKGSQKEGDNPESEGEGTEETVSPARNGSLSVVNGERSGEDTDDTTPLGRVIDIRV